MADADPNVTSLKAQTPLLAAIESNSLELVKILVKAGADIEMADSFNSNTPLHQACLHFPSNARLDIVKYLIACGANVNTKNNSGFTPLLTAILQNYSINVRLIKLLLRSGCDPDEANKAGISPLLATIRRSSDHFDDGVETVQLLIDHGCNVNAREFEYCNQAPVLTPGDTALNISIDRNQDSITEKLIRNGANVSVENSHGKIPIFSLLRDRKYVLARQAIAIMPFISTKHLQQLLIHHYLSDEYQMDEDTKNFQQIKRFLLQRWPYFPRLMHLCRCSLRKFLGKNSDQLIEQLCLPESIRMFLMLKQL
ncbi:B-cell lymphoma 3 protein homolog isoform X2 [Dermatophagoides farinae]